MMFMTPVTHKFALDFSDVFSDLDRMEKALNSELSAVSEAKKEFGIDVYSVVTMNDIIDAIEKGVVDGKEHLPAMYAYRETYGAK